MPIFWFKISFNRKPNLIFVSPLQSGRSQGSVLVHFSLISLFLIYSSPFFLFLVLKYLSATFIIPKKAFLKFNHFIEWTLALYESTSYFLQGMYFNGSDQRFEYVDPKICLIKFQIKIQKFWINFRWKWLSWLFTKKDYFASFLFWIPTKCLWSSVF